MPTWRKLMPTRRRPTCRRRTRKPFTDQCSRVVADRMDAGMLSVLTKQQLPVEGPCRYKLLEKTWNAEFHRENWRYTLLLVAISAQWFREGS